MADQGYETKLESLQRYIPFLVNMMAELKAKGNREAQLTKIQSLHDMITDNRKKLKLETLKRCEEVLTNIYFKVNPQLRLSKNATKLDSPKTLPGIESPRSTPQSPSPPRDIIPTKPVTIPTEKVVTPSAGFNARSPPKTNRPKINVYSNVVINKPFETKAPVMATKGPDMSKPPISLDDLKTLEDDVQQKISDAVFSNKSVDELQEVRKHLQLQLRVDQVTSAMSPEKSTINTTARNTPNNAKRFSFNESKQKVNESPPKASTNPTNPIMEIKFNAKNNEDKTSSKTSKKVLKEADIFGSMLSSIDDKILEDKKKMKKSDRRSSLTKDNSGSTTSLSSDKSVGKEAETKKGKESKDKKRDLSKHRRPSTDKDKKRDKTKTDTKEKSRSKSKDSLNSKNINKQDDIKNDQHKTDNDEKDKTLSKSDKMSNRLDSIKPSSEVDLKSIDSLKSGTSVKPQATLDSKSSSSDSIESDNTLKPVSMYKRLADKYNPKPKPKASDVDSPDVDKAVSESIEKLMKVSPAKPAIANKPSNVNITTPQNRPVQLPDILQKIFSKPLLGDIIPNIISNPRVPSSNSAQIRPQNSNLVMNNPGPMPPLLSPPNKPMQFQPPNFMPSSHGSEQMPTPEIVPPHGSGLGILPTPPIPPNLPLGFFDRGMNMGFGTPRVDFDPPGTPMTDFTPGTPMPDFTPGTPMPDFDSPRLEFEPPGYMRNDQFNLNQNFMTEHQMHGFDPRNANFMAQGHYTQQPELNHFHPHELAQGGYYGGNQMPFLATPEVPPYMPDQTFYQERSRWARDRRSNDPRNYREYKEMKDRQVRTAQEKQKDIKDPRLAPRESRDSHVENVRDPRLSKEAHTELGIKDQSESKDTRVSMGRETNVEYTNNADRREKGKNRDRGPGEPQSRDKFKDSAATKDPRSRGRESRLDSSKFDKMYSKTNTGTSQSRSRDKEVKEEDDEAFISPLDSLYNAGEKRRTGRGYGVQNFKIPRKPKWQEAKRKDEKKEDEKGSGSTNRRRRVIELSDSEESDTNNVDDGPIADDSGEEVVEGESSKKEEENSKKEKTTKEIEKPVTSNKSDIDTSRIKVVIKSKWTSDIWETGTKTVESSETDDFISEYDREFQNQNKGSASKTTTDSNKEIIPKVSKTSVKRKTVNTRKAVPKAPEVEIQVEEPSSSQDDLKQPSQLAKVDSLKELDDASAEQLAANTCKKPAEPAEADSSKKSDGAVTPQETSSKNEEPSEQNILAHFFENLLKSQNKKDKKTALFSLIETFSDSFEAKEIQKIRKIINVNDEASDDDKEEFNNATLDEQSIVENTHESGKIIMPLEEQPIVGSTTEEENGVAESGEVTEAIFKEQPGINDTQVNEVTKSTDESEQQHFATDELKSDESLNQTRDLDFDPSLDPVIVSVGERIKNRKRNPTRPKKKYKSELDLLHEDIQDMFIRDGVLTASGKRMCRILKDDPNVLASSDVTVPTSVVAEQPKKIRKKPGPKPKIKASNQEVIFNSMRDMRVVIKKIPDDVLNTSNVSGRQLRSRNSQNNYVETDDEIQESILDDASLFTDSFDAGSDKSDLEGESAGDSEEEEDKKSQNSEDASKPRHKRRKVPKWASGIIPKIKKKKASQNKSKENSPERINSPALNTSSYCDSLTEFEGDRLVEPDKDYYYDYVNKKKLKCKLCKYCGHLLTGHYLKEHPQSEVLSSRFPPQVAAEAIEDFAANEKTLENILTFKVNTKYHFSCRMCGYTSFVLPILFYEHLTTHTGEYRHQCGICEYFAVTSKTMSGHFVAAHPDQERKTIRTAYTFPVVYAYMCGECNFVQLKEKSVEDHANIFHLGEQPTIYKINMSTILDPQLTNAQEGLKAIEPKPIDNNLVTDNVECETPLVVEAKTRKKTGPKPKLAGKEKKTEDEVDNVTPVLRKRPGPRSKTLPIVEKETTTNVTDNVDNSPSITPIRKKPGPKSKTQNLTSVAPEESSVEDESTNQQNQKGITPPPPASSSPTLLQEDVLAKDVSAKKRRRSLDKLISEDSGDDLDTIITLSSRSNRAAKDKATAKLKTLMENNEGVSVRRKTDSESSKKSADTEAEHNRQQIGYTEKDQTGNVPETQTNQVEKMHPPLIHDNTKDKDQNVFTCKNDILQEDAKKIEEDRLRQMDELNKSIGARTLKLDFINKLSNRLNDEEQSNEDIQVKVKVEPKDNYASNSLTASKDKPATPPLVHEPITRTPPISKVSNFPIVSKKPQFGEASAVQQSNIQFGQNKPNSLFSNMIEKLQGKVNEAAVEQVVTDHMEPSIEEATPTDVQISSTPEVFISIGDLIRATKTDKEIIYSCRANNCYVATKDKMVFQLHCKFGHKDLNLKSSLCEKCGVVVQVTQDTTLLENLYDHLVFAHSDFLAKSSILRMRRLSGDKLSIKKEKQAPTQVAAPPAQPQDFEASINRHVVTLASADLPIVQPMEVEHSNTEENTEPAASEASLELSEDNPFSFKIASVMSLAESNVSGSPQSSPTTTTANVPSKPPTLPALKLVPPLTLIGTVAKQQTSTTQPLIVKEAKLTAAELSRPKKTPKALQKFIETPGDLYKCPHFYCMFTTNVRTLLMCHLKAHKCDSAIMVPCVYCDMKTPWEHVPMHIDIRHASCRYSCSHCLYRAALKEYVCLHQEEAHPEMDLIVIALPSHKAAKKFSIADSKTDFKNLCEPFRCLCHKKEDGGWEVKEYLFETEFVQHLNTVHTHPSLPCGYKMCGISVSRGRMLHHWAKNHGICSYQCGYCKTSSKEVSKMYTHFSQLHPNRIPDILIRRNEYFSPDGPLMYSEEAFRQIAHVRKIPTTLLTAIGKRAQRSIKLIQLSALSGLSEEPNDSGRPEKTPTSVSVLRKPATSSQSVPTLLSHTPMLLSNPNMKLIVATTSGSSENKLYLLPTSMVSPPKGQSVTSNALITKGAVQTSTASKTILKEAETVPQEPVRIGDITIYPADGPETVQLGTGNNQESAMRSQSGSPVFTSFDVNSIGKVTAKIQSISKMSSISSTNDELAKDNAFSAFFQDDMASENDSTAVSEDDMLQSAIQSILDQDDESNNSNTRLESNLLNDMAQPATTPSVSGPSTPPPLLPDHMLDPPPLVFITNSPETLTVPSNAVQPDVQAQSEQTSEVVAPVEHVDVGGTALEEEDPLTLKSNEELNPIEDSDAADPLSEDPLTISPSLNLDLSSGDPLCLDELAALLDPLEPEPTPIQPNEAKSSTNPVKIATMQRSVSMVSTSDDESDSSGSDKRKLGLIGYQLFRCAVCNLSFSNVKPFKSHIGTSMTCKRSGPKGFQCVHCEKGLKTPQRLADHILTHGVQRFSCSLCNEKFTTVGIAKLHLKNRHSIPQTQLVPLKSDRNNMETDDFMIKPCQANPPMAKDREALLEGPKPAGEDHSYNPDQIESIPIRQIFNTNVKCGVCNYQTKVRVNIIRHLQMHLDERAVSDFAPVNPVPCLEKNEKMFDKMINLAASSITTGRMGGPGKVNEKEEEKFPEFIPTHRRFVCCAQGCSYLCPEEGNLKHHLMALHSDESAFTCAHCKVKIEPSDIDNVIKHFKMHGLHLYKCQYCNFVHHLKHKVEKHISEGHLDVAVKVVTVRYMESEPQDFSSQVEISVPPPTTSSKFKPWSCGMCKAKYHTKEDVKLHITKKHNVDTQFKCALCAFKNDDEVICRDHFERNHPSHAFDIIFVYQKLEEEVPKEDPVTPFDTTPLWQRDKPRVRHIRGILFDESSPQPTKSPKKVKTYGSASSSKASASMSSTAPKVTASIAAIIPPKATNSTASSTFWSTTAAKNLFDCIDAVAKGTAETLRDKPGSSGLSSAKKATVDKESLEKATTAAAKEDPLKNEVAGDLGNDDVVEVTQIPNVIVIDSDGSDAEGKPEDEASKPKDDDTPKTKDKDSKIKPVAKNRALKRPGTTDLLHEAVKMAKIEETEDEDYVMASSCSRQNLINTYGGFGSPHNKQWKCPKCNQFKSKRVGDFMFHMYKDFNTYRYRCKVCSDLSITYKYMQDHIKLHPSFNEEVIEALPQNFKLDTWIHMVVREQSLVILKNAPLFKKRPITGPTDIICYFCNEKFMSMPECCEHMLYHWVMMPYQCQHCPNEFYTVYDLKHHHNIEHPDAKLYSDPKGPTLTRAVQCIENLKKRSPKSPPDTPSIKKARTDESPNDSKVKSEEITSGIVINTYKRRRASKAAASPNITSCDVINLEDDEDDLVIVSKTDDRVPNDDDVFACDACVYIADTEVLVVKHLLEKHGVRTSRFHILSKMKSETEAAQQMACNICDETFSELKLRRHFIDNHLECQMYAPYRFKCGLCFGKFLTPSRVKMHFTRVHAGSKLSYHCAIPMGKTSLGVTKCKYKQYVCTLCSYTTLSGTTVSIRSHLKGHLKPMICNHCNARFRYHSEVMSHSTKEHPGIKPAYSTLSDVMKEFSETIKTITDRAVIVPDNSSTSTEVSGVPAPASLLKNVAKKSTSTPFSSPKDYPEGAEEYSYYGVPQNELDLSSISTTFELDTLEYTTTAEQMMKMFNMDTYVDMSGCMVDIMPLDQS